MKSFAAFLPQVWGESWADKVKALITFIALLVTVVTAGYSIVTSPSREGSSASSPSGPPSGYVQPDVGTQVRIDRIRDEVYEAVNTMRSEANVGQAFAYQERSDAATEKAQLNAVTGREDRVGESIGMLQVHLPLEQASGWQFIELLRTSEAHARVMLDPQYHHMGVGVAFSNGTVWLVIQFEK